MTTRLDSVGLKLSLSEEVIWALRKMAHHNEVSVTELLRRLISMGWHYPEKRHCTEVSPRRRLRSWLKLRLHIELKVITVPVVLRSDVVEALHEMARQDGVVLLEEVRRLIIMGWTHREWLSSYR